MGAMSEAPGCPPVPLHVERNAALKLRQFHVLSKPAAASLTLTECDLHVWRARLDIPPDRVEHLRRGLAPAELRQIAHLRGPRDRQRAAASRGLVRQVLAEYVGRPAADLVLRFGRAGRPELEPGSGAARLHFNSTHSGDLLLIAVGRVPVLGIDVERIRPIARLEGVARRAFSDEEYGRIMSLSADARNEAFLACWTRKEACAKAVGQGVWSGFGRFEVSVGSTTPALVLTVDGDAEEAKPWNLYHLEPAKGYLGALAVRGAGFRVSGGTLDSLERPT